MKCGEMHELLGVESTVAFEGRIFTNICHTASVLGLVIYLKWTTNR